MTLDLNAMEKSEPPLLLAEYREMSADSEREREAGEWCEALVSDAIPDGEADDPQGS